MQQAAHCFEQCSLTAIFHIKSLAAVAVKASTDPVIAIASFSTIFAHSCLGLPLIRTKASFAGLKVPDWKVMLRIASLSKCDQVH